MKNLLQKGYVIIENYIERIFFRDIQLQHLKQSQVEILERGAQGYRIKTQELGLSRDDCSLLEHYREPSGESVIAEIDHDSFFLSRYSTLRDVATVTQDEFRARRRVYLQLVDVSGWAGIRKNYRGNFRAFINELRVLHLLAHPGINVPAVLKIDFDLPSLTLSYIQGNNLAEELVHRGVLLRNRDIASHPEYQGLSKKERWKRSDAAGKAIVDEVVDQKFVQELIDQVRKIHQCRICWNDIKYRHILIEHQSGQPFLIDFDFAGYYPNISERFFHQLCSRDWSLLKSLFNLEEEIESYHAEQPECQADREIMFDP